MRCGSRSIPLIDGGICAPIYSCMMVDFDGAYEGGVHGLMFPDDGKQTVGSHLDEMQSIPRL